MMPDKLHGSCMVQPMKWSLRQWWPTKGKAPIPVINARLESIVEKPTLRSLASRGRCVVLADGWLEWREEDGKQPYLAHRPEGGLLPLAGLWDVFENELGERDYRFAIVTRAAREDVDGSTIGCRQSCRRARSRGGSRP